MGAAVYFALSRLDAFRPDLSERSDASSHTQNVAAVATVDSGRLVRSGHILTPLFGRTQHFSDGSVG
jgi:hypothetical protein